MKKINGNPEIVKPTDNPSTTELTRIISPVDDFSIFSKIT